jgi:pyruvate dehydrogenase E2 component (dihydrolipoamide acetyltransferase)
MPFEIIMPQLGLTMETGTIVEWLVKEGEQIAPGQEIIDIETDKAVVAVEARQAGTIARILVPPGQDVPVGTILAIGLSPGESMPAEWQPDLTAMAPVPAPKSVTQGIQTPETRASSRADPRQVSWKARRMASEAGLDLRGVSGSGPGGRIVAKDVAQALATSSIEMPPQIRVSPVAAQLASTLGLDLRHVTGSGPEGQIRQTDVIAAAAAVIQGRAGPGPISTLGPAQVANVVPLTGVRGTVSKRMAASGTTTARVTLLREVDATALIELRERFNAGLHLAQVSYNDILIRICAAALREHPEANARMGDGQIEWLDQVNVGLAVDTDRGLLVPVIHSADTLTIPQIVAESTKLIEAARSGRCLPNDLTGGTFTITNLGMFRVEGFTPVINLPECCILGVGCFVRKPVVVDEHDTVAVRPMMALSLAFDHRVIDGAAAARFLDRIAQLIQEPSLLL